MEGVDSSVLNVEHLQQFRPYNAPSTEKGWLGYTGGSRVKWVERPDGVHVDTQLSRQREGGLEHFGGSRTK